MLALNIVYKFLIYALKLTMILAWKKNETWNKK